MSGNAKKIDLIRVMNAWYESGRVVDADGHKVAKKVYFEWVGKLFNLDLSHYDKDLSNSTSTGTSEETQVQIFDELRDKHLELCDRRMSK